MTNSTPCTRECFRLRVCDAEVQKCSSRSESARSRAARATPGTQKLPSNMARAPCPPPQAATRGSACPTYKHAVRQREPHISNVSPLSKSSILLAMRTDARLNAGSFLPPPTRAFNLFFRAWPAIKIVQPILVQQRHRDGSSTTKG